MTRRFAVVLIILALAALLILLENGPVDVHLLAAASCGALFLVAIRGVVVISTMSIGRVRRWWTEPPGQMWKRNSNWTFVESVERNGDEEARWNLKSRS